MGLLNKLWPRKTRKPFYKNIKTKEEWDELIDSGAVITKLNIQINDTSKMEVNPLDWTIREIIKGAALSNSAVTRGYLTLADARDDNPEIMYAIIISDSLVKKATNLLEELEKEELE